MPKLDQTLRNAAPSTGPGPAGGFAPLVPELDVTDLAASLRFWCGLLGFAIAYDRPDARFAFLEREGAQVMLCEVNGEWLTGALERPFGRGLNLEMRTTALAPILAALAAANWPLYRPPEEKTYRIGPRTSRSREMLVQDPDGYLLRFSEPLA